MKEILSTSIDSYKGEIIEKVYPNFSIKLLFKEIRNIFSGICYLAVWNSEPPTVSAWRKQKIEKNRFSYLYDNCQRMLPKTYGKLSEIFDNENPELDIKEAAQLLIDARDELYPEILKANKTLDKTVLVNKLSLQTWKNNSKHQGEINLIDNFIKEIHSQKPQGLKAVLLHGSIADGLTSPGFSDFDVHYVVKFPDDSQKLIELMQWIFESNHYLLSYNPFMHHGPMIVLEEELLACTELTFPGILVEKGVWLYGNVKEVYYTNGDFENIISFNVFKDFFESTITETKNIKNVFDALWWTSSVLFLPLLFTQMITGKSQWKRDVLTSRNDISENYWGLIDKVSKVRDNISLYVQSKMTLPLKIQDRKKNPGLIIKQYKESMQLTESEVLDLGITPVLLHQAAEYYHYCESAALKLNEECFSNKGYNFENVNSNWIKGVCEIPNVIPLEKYDEVRTEFLRRCSSNENVVAVYEFGNVGCPGLSDLDFLVVLSDDYFGIPSELTIDNMSKSHADVMNHDPLFVSESEVEVFGMFSPIFNCKQVYGNPLSIASSNSFSREIQETCYTIQNLVKYPNDLISLSRQEKIRWKTLLAFLNSFNHVKNTIVISTSEVPASLQKCVELNKEIRTKFSNGEASLEDLDNAFKLMIEASVDMVQVYQQTWIEKIPQLKNLFPEEDISSYKEKVYASLKDEKDSLPPLPASLATVIDVLQLKYDADLNLESTVGLIADHFNSFLKGKGEYIKRELSKGRKIHDYIAPHQLKEKYRVGLENTVLSLNPNEKFDLTTPVLFLIFNRPDLSFKIFERIKKVKPKKLYVAADGPRENKIGDKEKCDLTKQILLGIDWNCEIKTLFREVNLGCKYAVSSALNWFFENEEAGIIVEDDILAEPEFFYFCQEMLLKYADDQRIMHVTGNNLQFGWKANDYSYYFSMYGSIWGWATWRRAWKYYDIEMKKYPRFLTEGHLRSLFSDEKEFLFRKATFDDVYFKGLDTWDYQWTFARLSNNGLAIVPAENLIKNIGFQGDATHTKDENDKRANLQVSKLSFPLKFPDIMVCDKAADERYFNLIISNNINYSKTPGFKFNQEEIYNLLMKTETAINDGDNEYAKELLGIVLKQEPDNLNALNNLAVIKIMEEDYARAIQLLNRVLSIDPIDKVAIDNSNVLISILKNESLTLPDEKTESKTNSEEKNSSR